MTDTEKAEYEDILGRLTAKCQELAAENARLRSEKSDSLSFLREMFNDPAVSPALRLKAAGLVLPHEVPKLMPERAPLELSAEPIEPLAVTVEKQRARLNRMLALPLEVRSELSLGVRGDSGNGPDTDSDDELFGLPR
jgi:hypothetical protein